MSAAEIEDLLYHRSGLLGISGISSDMRTLLANNNPHAALDGLLMGTRPGTLDPGACLGRRGFLSPGRARQQSMSASLRKRPKCCVAAKMKQHRYSITSSARASSVGGTSRPSALAVLRLISISNLVGCSTGRSAGFAPLKILSTYSAARRSMTSGFGP
jgi:hypothetical protein